MANNLSVVIGADVTGFNSAINSAQNVLNKYASNAKKASKEIDKNVSVTNSQVESYKRTIKQLEKVNSGAMTSTQQHKALANQIKELKIQFANLSAEAKKGEFGKSVSASLKAAEKQYTTLDTQIKTVNGTLGKNASSAGSAKGGLDALGGSLGSNILSLTKFGGALGVVTGALDLAKDALLHTEGAIDEWGRTCKGAESAYSVLLDSLNEGNWDNFFTNISNAINDARDLYDALDRAGSVRANNKWAIAVQENLLETMKAARDSGQKLWNGQDINKAILGQSNRVTALKNQGANADLAAAGQGIQSILTRSGAMNKATANYFSEQIKNSGQGIFDKADKVVKSLGKYWKETTYATSTYVPGGGFVPSTRTEKKWTGSKAQLRQYNAYKALIDRESELQPFIEKGGSAVSEIAGNTRAEGRYRRQANKSATSGGSGSGKKEEKTVKDYASDFFKALRAEALINAGTIAPPPQGKLDYSSLATKPTDNRAELAQRNFASFKNIQDQFNQGLLDEETAQRMIDTLNGQFQRNGIDIKLNLDTTDIDKARKKIANTIGLIDDMGSSLSQMGSSMGIPELDSAGLIAGAIASIIQGYGTATAQASSMGPWAWIAFAVAGAATMASVIAEINSMKGFADGGIISGSRTIGDYNLARVNSGEMILNGTSQKRLFNLINNGGMVGDGGSPVVTEVRVKGSDLYLALSNYKKSSPGRKTI